MAKQAQQESRAIVPIDTLAPSRLPITANLMTLLEITEPQWRVLTDQLYPAARTVDAVALVLNYCRARNLDPMKKPCHIVPMWSTALRRYVETVWPGIAELRTTATRTRAYAGIDSALYGPIIEREFVQPAYEDQQDPRQSTKERRLTLSYPEWCELVVYRLVGNRRCPFHARVYWEEAYATAGRFSEMPNEMWAKRKFGQIEKCTEAAALRRAFPEELGGELTSEEMAGRVIEHEDDPAMIEHIAKPIQTQARPPKPPAKPTPNGDVGKSETIRRNDGDKAVDKSAATTIEDATVIDQTGRHDSPDDGPGVMSEGDAEFLDDLGERLAEAHDEAEFETIWNDIDPIAHFKGDEGNQQVALSIKTFRLSQLTKGRRK